MGQTAAFGLSQAHLVATMPLMFALSELPKGTVTFLFTDIEGSTRLLGELGVEAYADSLKEHRQVMREAVFAHGGVEVDTQGDAFFFAFSTAPDALAAAAAAQDALAIPVRMGLHSGTPLVTDEGYVGEDVHRAARIAAAGHGRQIVVSASTAALLDTEQLRDLGPHRLKDLTAPQRLYQVGNGEFPPLKSLNQTNLPVQATALIGRDRELREVRALLCRADARLVTLTGAGGSGKTRLALQVGAESSDEFVDGVFFVSLAPIRNPTLIVPTIAQTIGVREQGPEPLIDTLKDYLRAKQVLLILDNFEQIAEAASSVAAAFSGARSLRLLVTSRVPLHLTGERTYEVPPLALPNLHHLPDLAALMEYEAVALFVERAQAVKSSFAVTNDNAPAVAEICVRLDGLPLALELAAARIRVLPPQALLSRLDQRLGLLTGGARDLEARQRTLRATIDWSYELLSREEKALFARLSVFAAGCRFEAAEAVCAENERPGLDLLDGLQSLVEKSLVREREDPDGAPRFWLFETVREYAQERLRDTGEDDAIRRLAADYFLSFVELVGKDLQRDPAVVELCELELPNLRETREWLRREGLAARELALAADLWWLFLTRGRWTEGRLWLDGALEQDGGETRVRGRALEGASDLAYRCGDLERSYLYGNELLALGGVMRDDAAKAIGWCHLGRVAQKRGDLEQAAHDFRESLRLSRGTPYSTYPLGCLGWVALETGAYDEANRLFTEAHELDRKTDNRRQLAFSYSELAFVALLTERLDDAQHLLECSIAAAVAMGDMSAFERGLQGLAALYALHGESREAARLLAMANSVRQHLRTPQRTQTAELLWQKLAAQGVVSPEDLEPEEASGDCSEVTLDEMISHALDRAQSLKQR